METNNSAQEPMVKPLVKNIPLPHVTVIVVFLVAIILGSLTGYVVAGKKPASVALQSEKTIDNKTVVGSSDTSLYKDCARGVLTKNDGKITTEGTHKLLREGGESQSVYLTSSVVDLDSFLNKKVEVCGQTQKAEKAGWLMDIGRVKLQ